MYGTNYFGTKTNTTTRIMEAMSPSLAKESFIEVPILTCVQVADALLFIEHT